MLKHPRIVIGLVIALTLFFGGAALSIVIDNDLMIFFPEDNPSFVRKEALEDNYGSQIMMDICITTEEDSLFTWENLDMIENLIGGIEDLPHVQDVSGITNTDYPVGTEEGMSVSPLIPEGEARTAQNLKEFKARLLDWSDAYRRTLYSDDFKSTQILVRIDQESHSKDIEVLLDQVRGLIEPYDSYPLTFRIAGDPVVTQIGKQYMYADLMVLIPIVAVVLFLCLFLSFRRISSALLPLITVMIATVWTVGTMALSGATFTIISSCLPVLIIAVGSAYGIHVINHYYHSRRELGEGDVKETIRHSLKDVFLPIMLAGVTTLIGFLSILTSPILPMKAFGVFAGVGTVYSLILSFFLIPVLLEFAEKRRRKDADAPPEEEYSHSRALLNIVSLSVKYKKTTALVALLLAGVSFWGLTRINVESSLIGYFPYKEPIRQDSRFIDDHFGGTNMFNVVFAADEGYDLTDPAVLKSMDDLKQFLLKNYPETVGQIISYSDFIKRMNQIMNYPVSDEGAADVDAAPDGDPVEADSFFGGDSFFAEDTAGTDSFFAEDFPAETESAAGSVTAEYVPLG
ncbi:MAG: MMPL family transporter, partial [Spirochaetales bacterium]|nr:MMPL family transporter [Spirochaetales bacterium]